MAFVPAQQEKVQFCVQNTFIHVVEDSAEAKSTQKRSSSTPASQRFCERDAFLKSDRKGSLSELEISTAASSPLCGSVTPCSLEDDVHYQSAGELSIGDATCMWNPSMMPVFYVGGVFETPAGQYEQPAAPAAPAPAQLAPTPLKLNKEAKAWSPDVATEPVSKAANKEANALNRRLTIVMEAVKNVLITCLWIANVEVSEDQLGPCLTLRVTPENMERQDTLLMLAKAALSSNITAVDTLHMLGCKADPFVPMPAGMAVKVCSVKDEQKVCWDLLSYGVCRFNEKCHWRHPKCQKRIAVKILLDESA
eukprot:TRINITY_DN91698_c0_g1_i1.p1 TRINITY_DN91698_c0_g1~~TRINITY_DN91698_c0_g1_i1.p1  ORF type:complete len:352 (-),score=65.45 TRINITY_DN91698_c0_g1_i1:361-1284(-)